MKAYVIKNKKGEYFTFSPQGFPKVFKKDIRCAMIFKNNAVSQRYNNYVLKDCTIVPITICEGDLKEKYKVLQGVIRLAMDYACKDKKLYKRIQDFNTNTDRHNGDNSVYLEDAVCFLTKLSKDARDDAKKWGEFFEKVYQEQKAQESEKDER